MRESHERLLSDILHEAWGRENPDWPGSTFEVAKRLSTTGKGNAIEDFALQLLKQVGHSDAERHHARRGDWDLRVGNTTIEVKGATLDIGGNFQFNGIRYDTKYDLLLVIGIAPEAVFSTSTARSNCTTSLSRPWRKAQTPDSNSPAHRKTSTPSPTSAMCSAI